MRSLRVSPSTYSNTMYGAPSSSPASITVTTWGWLRLATALASRRKRSSWPGSVEMSRCISLIATQRSRAGSKARYTDDIPPAPTFSSRRKRSPIKVPITVIYFARFNASPRPLLHRPRVRGVMGRRAGGQGAHGGVRPGPLVPVRDGGTCPRVRDAPAGQMAGGGRSLRDAGGSPHLAGGRDRLQLPGVHGRKGRGRAGRGRRLPLPARPAGGALLPAAQARYHRGAGGGG